MSIDVINDWVSQYGYVLVAAFLMIEAAGIPIPGETALVTAAAVAGNGTMHIVGVMIAAAIGTIGGGHLGFWMGVRSGHAILTKYGRFVGLNAVRLEKTRKFFDQHGAKTVATGRFVAFVRSFMGIFAGLSGMPLRTFTLYNAIGGVVWVLTFSLIGFVFGRNLPLLIHYIGRASLVVAVLIALIAVVVFGWRYYNKNRAAIVDALDKRYVRRASSARLSGIRLQHPSAWRFLSGRFAQSESLALHLLVGFAVSLAVIVIFGVITEGVVEGSPLTRFDVGVAAQLRESAAPAAIGVFTFVSKLGGQGVMTLFLLVGGLIYALRRRGIETSAWVVAFLGGALLDAALRFVVRRSELPYADIVQLDWGVGLASGHVLGVLVGYGMLAYLAASATPRTTTRTLVITIAIAFVSAITISRLYLGQNFVSDAAAGLAAGVLWLTACISGIEVSRQRHWER